MTRTRTIRDPAIASTAGRTTRAVLLTLLALASSPGLTAASDDVVKLSDGLVAGDRASDGVRIFKGIPFAAPPVGGLRWRAPQPVAPWTGTRSAKAFGTNCVQNIVPERKPWTSEFMASGPIGEDCLYLNVWTPSASAATRPVFVWFHGGGLVEGSGAIPIYDGTALAKKGVVVVTINYRLGIFGYFAHPDLTAEAAGRGASNFGYFDQIAALQWVQRNIAAFGGDPSRVTIGGQSAGAGSVHALTASPIARGLFTQAIAHSGSGVGRAARALADAERDGVRLAESVGARTLEDLRKLPPGALTSAVPPGAPIRWNAVVDGRLLPAEIDAVFARGQQNDVPTLTGLTADEGSSAPTYGTLGADAFRTVLRERFGDLADEALRLYPVSTPEQTTASQKASARDQGLVSMHVWASRRARTGRTKAYTYYWTHTLPGPDAGTYGAFHTSEVPYVFNALTAGRPFTGADRAIAETMSSYWANFIATGDPNGTALPRWPAFEPGKAMTMEAGDAFAPRSVADAERLALFTRYFERRIACAELARTPASNASDAARAACAPPGVR